MENRSYALFVGLFTLLLGGAVIAAFWWFSGGGEDTRDYLIVSPRSVTGLNPQAAVRFRGVRVGKVVDVDLQDSRDVYVTIRIAADVPITRGTKAKIGIQGLTGQGFIQLDDDGRSTLPPVRVANGLPLISMQEGLLDQAAEGAQEIIGRLRTSTERVEKILSTENLERIDQTLQNLSRSSAHLEKTLAQTAGLVGDLRRFSSAENADKLSTTLSRLNTASGQLAPAVEDFRRALNKVEAAGGRIDKLGAEVQTSVTGDTLPRMNALMQELHQSSQQLTRVLDDIERSPQMLLSGKRQLPDGPGETHP